MSNDQDLHGFLPSPTTTNELINHQQEPTQESQLAAALGRALSNIRDAVAAVNNSPILIPSLDNNQDQPSKTTTIPRKTRRRHPYRKTSSSDKKECPQIKRLRKMEEMVTEMEQKCCEFTRESGEILTQEQEHDGDDENVNETEVEQDEEEKEDEDIEDCVEFKRLDDDGSLRIQLSCSCAKRFEILHNKIGCFYRLM